MMAMKYFDPSLKLTRDLEIDIWRESNLVEDWSTCGRGLAYSAAKRGFGARIVASVDDIPFKEKILKVSPNADRKILEIFFRDMQKRALALDVKEEQAQELPLERRTRSIGSGSSFRVRSWWLQQSLYLG